MIVVGAGKSTFLVAKEFAFDKSGSNSTSVKDFKRVVTTFLIQMDGPRQNILSCSGLPKYHDRHIVGRDPFQ